MNLPFTALFERRDSLENPSVSLYKALTGYDRDTSSGVRVSTDTALSVPAVFACVQVLAQDLAKTPIKMRRLVDVDTFEDVQDHDLWEILHDLPNPETTAYDFKVQLMFDLLSESHAYAEIVRNPRGQIRSLWRLDPRGMSVDRDGLNRKRYTFRLADGSPKTWLFDADQPPIFELRYESPITRCRDLIGFAVALELYAAKFFANGARLSGVLSTEQSMNDLQRKNLRESFNAFYQGAANAFKVAVLEHGLKYESIAAPNNEAQLNEIQKYVRTVIAGAFRVPPHKIGDLERATFANIEHQAIEYVTGALDPLYVAWEQGTRRDLLTTRQYPRYDIVFDREAMIRADIQSRMNAFALARQNGIYTTNDILRKLGENTKSRTDGGDALLVNGNMLPIADVLEAKSHAPSKAETDATVAIEEHARLAQRVAHLEAQPRIAVHTPPVTVTAPEVRVENHVAPATVQVAPPAVQIDNHIAPAAVQVPVTVQPPAADPQTRTTRVTKRVVRDADGRIAHVIEQHAEE